MPRRSGPPADVTAKPLTFSEVDAISFAAAKGRLAVETSDPNYIAAELGPLMELFSLSASRRLPSNVAPWFVANGATGLVSALSRNTEAWASPDRRRIGLMRTVRADDDASITKFLMDAQRAARDVAGLPGSQPGQLAAAIREMENNIHEHSEASQTGTLAYRAAPGVFEFVAADRGVGVLASLRQCSTYAGLSDHGSALRSTLTDGHSRFGENVGRGYGFRPLFLGLMSLYGSLRFRSGDHALLMDGTDPSLTIARLAQKAPIDGFLVSVRCQTLPNKARRAARLQAG